MKQLRLNEKERVKYTTGPYNKFNNEEQYIRITDGCPHNCPYCYAPNKLEYYGIPKIVRNKVKILDMNLLANPKAYNIITKLGLTLVNKKFVYYELVCGVDYRFITLEIAAALKVFRFKNIRIAWDWFYKDQLNIKKCIDLLIKTGYKSEDLTIFMICNWKISFKECCNKLDLCKIWGVKVADCYYNNQLPPNIIPIDWTREQIKEFRAKVRTHNQLVNFKIDPEIL